MSYDGVEYVLLRFLIPTVDSGKIRLYAVLGDEDALSPSGTLKPRYYIIPLVQGREAMMQSNPHTVMQNCAVEVLGRFEAGLPDFLLRLTPDSVRSEYRPDKVTEYRANKVPDKGPRSEEPASVEASEKPTTQHRGAGAASLGAPLCAA